MKPSAWGGEKEKPVVNGGLHTFYMCLTKVSV